MGKAGKFYRVEMVALIIAGCGKSPDNAGQVDLDRTAEKIRNRVSLLLLESLN